jgi:hypothetical protein
MLISYSNHYFRSLFMRSNYHKLIHVYKKDIFWVPKPFYCYFEMTLHVGIAFKVGSSPRIISE